MVDDGLSRKLQSIAIEVATLETLLDTQSKVIAELQRELKLKNELIDLIYPVEK